MGDYEDFARKNFEDNGPKASAGEGNEPAFGVDEAAALNAVNYPSIEGGESTAADSAVHAAASAAAVVNTGVTLGRGLDVGTANLVSSNQDTAGNVNLKIQRNAFIDIDFAVDNTL